MSKDIRDAAMQRVTSAETRLGVTMPDEFKEYLVDMESWIITLQHDNVIDDVTDILSRSPFPMAHRHKADTIFFQVSEIFGVSDIWSVYRICEQVQYVNSTRPYTLLPFANDGCGNYFCVVTQKKYYGHVYFWAQDHQLFWMHGHQEYDISANQFLLSESFGEFLSRLEKVSQPQ